MYFHCTDNAEVITQPSGFTVEIDEVFSTHTTMQVSWLVAGASEPSTYESSSLSSENRIAYMLRISGADLTAPIDVSAFLNSTGIPSCPDVTTTEDNTLVLRLYAAAEGLGAFPGFTSGATGIRNGVSVYGGAAGTCAAGIAAELQASAGSVGAESWGVTALNAIAATIAIAPGVAPPAPDDSLFTAFMGSAF